MVCSYPGLRRKEVEELVTEPIEREVQSMRRVHKITSESYYGLSKIQVELDPATPAAEIPQLWDELRRKVLNVQPRLPARGFGGDRRRRFRRRVRHLLRAFGRRRLHLVRTARLGAPAQNGARDGRRRAEGGPLRRTDARGERLCQHGDAGQFRHPSRNHRRDHRPAEFHRRQR